jgi:L-threonylcarbamoyladenylate synthase
MTVTSANLSGQPSPSTASAVFHQLKGHISIIIDGGRTPGGIPSTVVDCTIQGIKILREGPIGMDEINSALQITC